METNRSKKIWLTILLSGVLLAPATSAWARDRGGWHQEGPSRGSHEVVVAGRDRYNYHDGHFYRPWWFGFEIALSVPPVGVIVTSIPVGHKTVIVGNNSYYYYDHVYYQPCQRGYVVVPAPAVNTNVVYVPAATTATTFSGDVITINVPNMDGSFIPVTLVPKNGGYVGPQGEYYAGHPTVDQLKVLYGK